MITSPRSSIILHRGGERARVERPHLTRPELVPAERASRVSTRPPRSRHPERADRHWTTSPTWRHGRCRTDDTIGLVASAPNYPFGTIDPGPLSLIAPRRAPFHVDACVGGFALPFLKKLPASPSRPRLAARGVDDVRPCTSRLRRARVPRWSCTGTGAPEPRGLPARRLVGRGLSPHHGRPAAGRNDRGGLGRVPALWRGRLPDPNRTCSTPACAAGSRRLPFPCPRDPAMYVGIRLDDRCQRWPTPWRSAAGTGRQLTTPPSLQCSPRSMRRRRRSGRSPRGGRRHRTKRPDRREALELRDIALTDERRCGAHATCTCPDGCGPRPEPTSTRSTTPSTPRCSLPSRRTRRPRYRSPSPTYPRHIAAYEFEIWRCCREEDGRRGRCWLGTARTP